MTAGNIRTRHFLRLLLGAGLLVLVVRLWTGHVVPRPQDLSARFEQLTAGAASGGAATRRRRPQGPLPCAELPGANDTVVVMKTGATELEAKLPIHFATTFRCFPNRLIVSDHAEDVDGDPVIDALEHVTADVLASNPDFALWRRLQKNGRQGLKPDELSAAPGAHKPAGGFGKPDNPGWKLDKWKFLPMVNRTLFEYPSKDWYIFVETDTYVFWSTTLAWLNSLNASEPHYLGAQMQIGDVVFGHGGSGFVLSQGAMRKVAELFRLEKRKWEGFVQEHWAGDCVLGRALGDAGAPLTWSWPIFQGLKPGAVDYARDDYSKRLWCYPTISYHHLSPDEIETIWEFEQDWMEKSPESPESPEPVRHKDVYNHYIWPRIEAMGRKEKHDWDNLSGDVVEGDAAATASSIKDCHAICKDNATCVQYSFAAGKCATSGSPKLGEARKDVQSGWFLDRAKLFADEMEPCGDELWIERIER